MKLKYLFAVMAILAMVCTCASSGKPATGAVSLDTAIQQASKDINDTLPAGTKVALLNFTSGSDVLSDYVIEEMSIALVKARKLTVVDRKEIDLIRGEMNFQMSGEVSDESAQEIGKLLGAQSIVSGSLVNMGDAHRFRTKVINVISAAIETSASISVVNDSQIQFLLSQGKGSAPRTAQGGTRATPAQADTSNQAQPATPTPAPAAPAVISFPRVGRWNVTGRGSSINWTANMVIDEIDIDRFSGYFEWRGGIDYDGREYFRGVYDPQTRKVSIQGYRLANSRGLGLGRYEAFLSRNNKDFESGTSGGGTIWEAKWQE